MTKRDFYEAVIEANISAEMTEYAEKAIATLDKANAKRKSKKTPEQTETDAKVLAVLTTDYVLASEIAKSIEGFTTSKVVASCKRLEAEGKVRITEARNGSRIIKSYALVETDEG